MSFQIQVLIFSGIYSLNHYFLGFGSLLNLNSSLKSLFFFSPPTWSFCYQVRGTRSGPTQSSGANSWTQFGRSGTEDLRLLALVLSGRFYIYFGRGYLPEARGAKAVFHRRETAVENILHLAFVCVMLEKMSICESQEEKWQCVSKLIWVPEEMRVRYTDGFKYVKSEKLEWLLLEFC